MSRQATVTGGRAATTSVIPGDCALSVGDPKTPLPEGWEWRLLAGLARLETGHTPARKNPEYWGGVIPWIGIRDATANHGRVIDDTAQHVTQAGIENSSARLLPADTVCLSRTASVGYVVQMGQPMATSQDFVNWVCDGELSPNYLRAVLLAERSSFLRFASGTTHQTIYFPEVKAFHIAWPPKEQRESIERIFTALDDKIELNRRMNETLEGVARAVFKSWFVDFDPVRAKLDGRAPHGMDADTAALFPDRFEHVDGELVPAGWKLSNLGAELTVIETGKRPRGGVKHILEGVPSVGAESITRIGEYDYSKTKYVPHEFYDSMRKGKVQSRDVLLYKDGGRPGLYEPHVTLFGDDFPFDEYCINEHVYRLVGSDVVTQPYLYLWLTTDDVEHEMRQKGTGVAIPGLNSTAVKSLGVLVPSDAVAGAFSKFAEPIVTQILGSSKESRILAELRDTLLPKLLSGELSVPAAEEAVEEVA